DATTMAELAFAGARVMHPHAVELAAAHGVELRVGHARAGVPGTVVHLGDMLDNGVVAVGHDLDVARVVLRCRRGRQDLRTAVFGVLARCRVPMDLVSHSGPEERVFRMGFTVRRGDLPAVQPHLRRTVAETGGTVV